MTRPCCAIYRVKSEGGPGRSCVLPAGHDGAHEDRRSLLESRDALRARVADLEAESERLSGLIRAHVRAGKSEIAAARREGGETMRALIMGRLRSYLGAADIDDIRLSVRPLGYYDTEATAATDALAAQARREGAEAMRERVATLCQAEGDRLEGRSKTGGLERDLVSATFDEERAIVCHRLADEIRTLPLDDDAREDAPAPVCAVCCDTHLMTLTADNGEQREVMCTRCPVPCDSCRAGGRGAFCESTPCGCDCHDARDAPATRTTLRSGSRSISPRCRGAAATGGPSARSSTAHRPRRSPTRQPALTSSGEALAMRRLIVSGTREVLSDEDRAIVAEIAMPYIERADEIGVGDSPTGVDAMIREVAIDAEVFVTNWRGIGAGLRAGPERNRELVAWCAEDPDGVLLAFPGPSSRGTWDCVQRARAAGLSVMIKRVGGVL